MGYFVQFSYTPPDRKGLQKGIAYISHREESLPGGRTGALYGIGERYRALRGDETAIVRQLWDDRRNLRSPVFYRAKLTVDDHAARRRLAVPEQDRERVLQDAVDRTFHSALRHSPGVYVIDQGGASRPFGHPYVHVRLSAALNHSRRFYLRPERLDLFKRTWEREVQRALDPRSNWRDRRAGSSATVREQARREGPGGRRGATAARDCCAPSYTRTRRASQIS